LRFHLQLPAGTGLVVDSALPDSPAAQAGIQPFDILTRFGDQLLINPPRLVTLVRGKNEGDKARITPLRKAKEQTLTVTLGRTETRPPRPPPEPMLRPEGRPERGPRLTIPDVDEWLQRGQAGFSRSQVRVFSGGGGGGFRVALAAGTAQNPPP
jgi:hypothetical protein